MDGKVTDTQVVADSNSPNPEPVAFGSGVIVEADGYYLVQPGGAERLNTPGERSTVCALWPRGAVALEATPKDPNNTEAGAQELQAHVLEDGAWSSREGSVRVVGDAGGLRVSPRCLPGGAQYGPSFWAPGTGWFTLEEEGLFASAEDAAAMTATGSVVLVSPPGPRQVTGKGAVEPLLSAETGQPLVTPPLATAYTVAFGEEGNSGLLLSAPAPSVDQAAQFFKVDP